MHLSYIFFIYISVSRTLRMHALCTMNTNNPQHVLFSSYVHVRVVCVCLGVFCACAHPCLCFVWVFARAHCVCAGTWYLEVDYHLQCYNRRYFGYAAFGALTLLVSYLSTMYTLPYIHPCSATHFQYSHNHPDLSCGNPTPGRHFAVPQQIQPRKCSDKKKIWTTLWGSGA